MYTLGINAAFHDQAAALVKDGVVLAAAEEERFTHIKHGKRPIPFSTYELPYNAIDFCLKTAGINLTDIDHIAYSFDPNLVIGDHQAKNTVEIPLRPGVNSLNGWQNPYDGLFLSSILNAPGHLVDGVPLHLSDRFRGATAQGPYQWHFVNHHLSHAASAFLPSPYERAAVLVIDGRGEVATTSYWLGDGNDMTLLDEVKLPHSLGLLYEELTTYLGFLHSSDEYKVMAVASYGEPTYVDYFRQIIQLGEGGQYTIAPLKLEETFGPARRRGGPLEQFHFDLAHSVQAVLEETVLHLLNWLHDKTQADSLCMAGGVALNCVMNARLRDRGPFKSIWVQPAAGDAGTALGAAMWIDAQQRPLPERAERRYEMHHAYLGPGFSDDEIEAFLRWSKLPYRRLTDRSQEVAAYLASGHIIGWFQQGMEFGPRALGARSILAPPFPAEMQAKLNDLKDREDFRPVAPAVLEEAADAYFLNARQSPFMLFVNDVRPEMVDAIPAVTHTDGTARIQTVNERQNKPYYDLIKAFAEQTGVPVLVNTSFNTRGEPVVCTPRDAVESFWTSPLDALVIGSFMLEKNRDGLNETYGELTQSETITADAQ
ncbi:carbamoyltransferase family protein [Spirosoma fluviale]|uniref:Beta-1,4-N-acetylglucosamine oligosaccharide 6-O-carbamoyltransferase NodU n=1 Tax=Spirosoma fluviale TaxID=1597977 RepID=A0A286F817_9BACT|nr:carbamoyltransferase C-terminal domain-containing protein [Spirosoma fluviale]SOD79355.1 beta-1,4-N-acetylglucosamine oligosaccharide 6-O-carbamoyltransferase NodU [Spirosoma fluviale]